MEKLIKEDLKQKARVKWLKDGDANSSFFLGMINGNKKRNRIQVLKINGEWVADLGRVKNKLNYILCCLF